MLGYVACIPVKHTTWSTPGFFSFSQVQSCNLFFCFPLELLMVSSEARMGEQSSQECSQNSESKRAWNQDARGTYRQRVKWDIVWRENHIENRRREVGAAPELPECVRMYEKEKQKEMEKGEAVWQAHGAHHRGMMMRGAVAVNSRNQCERAGMAFWKSGNVDGLQVHEKIGKAENMSSYRSAGSSVSVSRETKGLSRSSVLCLWFTWWPWVGELYLLLGSPCGWGSFSRDSHRKVWKSPDPRKAEIDSRSHIVWREGR